MKKAIDLKDQNKEGMINVVSKNNWQYQQQRQAQRVPHYGLRKLSVGVASVLLSTTLYMGVSAHADTVVTPGETTTPATTTVATPSPSADKATSETAGSGANATSTDPTSEMPTSQATPSSAGTTSEKPVDSVAGAKGVSETADSKVGGGTPVNDGQAANPQSTVNRLANTTGTTTTTVASDATRKTTLNTTVTWTIHYVDETGNHLQPDSVVSHDYARTDIGDQMGNWSYVPNSVKVTGTPNAGSHIDNPDFKFDQIDGKTTFDYASWYAAAASIDGYTPDYSSVVIIDQLPKNPEGLHATTIIDSGKHEYTFVYTQRPKTVTINYVNDDDNENVVKTDSVNGKPNTEVTITPNLPSGYMLTPGKDVPSKYTVTDGDNQALTIHVQKQFVDVSDTDPQAKQTRTITLHYVYDGGSKDGQKAFDDAVLDVYYHRTATFDRSTNQTTYGDWTWDNSQGDTSTPGYHVVSGKWTNLPQSWANVTADVPNIKGYHADLGQNDPTNTNHVPANTWVFPTYNNRAGAGVSDSNKGATAYLDGYGYEVSPTHTIKYVPNQTTVTVNYVDDDNNKANVGSQHWDGTIGQHIDLTLTPPTNYVLSPGWANPTSYDFDGVNSSWFTVHVKHATQDVTATQPIDQVNKTETLTRKHLYGPGPHEGEKFGEPDILEVPWHRTATKDLVTNKVSFGDWHVIWDEVKQLSGATKMWGDSEHHWVNGGLIAGHSGYSYLGVGAKTEAITTDGTVSGHGWYWMGEQDIENNPTIVQYYGREKVGVPVNYVDFDTNQQLGTKRLTGDDYLDGNTITINKGDLTDWGTIINKKYQLYAGQTLPTTYKIDTVSNNGNLTPITVYVVQPRTVQFTFADKDSTVNGQHPQVGDAVSVTGVTGSTTPVNLTVPAGYKLVEGQQLPTTYTFVKGGQNQVILLTHQHVTVNPDSPKTPSDKLPDNPGKSYPSGVSESDLNKTITRTIKITRPDGTVTNKVQTVKLTRNADVDEVTGEVTYGKWTTGQWDSYEIPALKGYTASQTNVEATPVDENTKDQTVEINYTPNKQSTTIKYVDDKGQTIHTTTVDGVTDQTVKVPNEVPAGWMITKGEVPSEITFGADAHEPVVITVDHQHVIVDPDQPQNNGTKLPDNPAKTFSGVETNDLNKTITRTIKLTTPDGQTKTVAQTAKLTRNADVDEVTGEVTYGKWTTGQWDSYEIPALKGYTPSQASVEATPVDESTKDQSVEVNYIPNRQSTTIKYVDDKGDVVHTTTVTGVTDQTVNVPSEVPAGWMITKGEVPSEITFDADGHEPIEVTVDHRHITVTPDQPQNNGTKLPDNPAKIFSGVEANDLNKTITRTIKVTTPDGKSTTTKQTVKLTRTADVDEVTGEVTYGNWTTGQWDAYEVPALKGYTASQTSVETTPVDENTKDQTVEVSYTPNKQSTTIKYVDDKGQIIHTTTVNGLTDQTVKVPNEVPAGWMITKGEVPSELTFGVDGHEPIEVTVDHQHVTVDPDHPQNNGTKLPDNPAKNFNGVEVNDLNKTITRTIEVTTPDGKSTTTKQTVKLTRTADVDEVTGEVTYGKWTTGQWNAYEVPALNGYIASQTSVEATPVDENTKDQTVEVSYTPNKQSTTIKYVDDKGQTIHTTTVNGLTDQKVKVPNEVPAGWMITKGKVPSEITFGADGHEPIEVTVVHQHVTVDSDHPQNNGTKLPDNPAKTFEGVEANNLNKIITRTIKVTTPDGKSTTTKQTVKLTRTADVDEVTGEVTYGNWTTGEWTAYNAPSVTGYTPSQTAVAKESVTATSNDTTVEITYQPMQHQISVEYVDDDDHGKVVKIDQVPGKTDQAITVTPSAPVNYDLVDNGSRTYTVTSDDAQAVQIHVKHHQVTTSESKTVTRTVNVHTPHDGAKVVKQTAELTRNVTTDQVTGDKTYGDWTTGQWESYTPEAIPGYTPSTNEVLKTNVDGNSTNQMVDVTYTADAQKVEIVYVDDAKGDAVVKTDQIDGKTDETVKVTPDVPTGYELVGKVPSDYTMTADGHQTITVHLVHQMKTSSESKTVTRTINVHTPHDGVKVVKQTAELTRNVTTDQVTGDKTYGDWSTTEWDRYVVPAIAGYVPSIEQVAQQVVNGTTTDQTIDVIYSSGEHTTHINYVDGDGNIVHTTTIKGQTDGTVQVPNETPAGWMVVGEPVPTELAFGSDGHADVTVTVEHQHVTVTPDQPRENGTKLPDNSAKTFNGVEANDLNKTITRTIKVTTPDGQIKTVAQTAKLTRIADVDEVTGEVTYGKWSAGQWDSYEIPTLKGYTASQTNVEATPVDENTKDQTVEINYTPNKQSTTIKYVDDKGDVVHTTTVTGVTDQTVNVPSEVPAGWTITKGKVPSEITFGADGHESVVITVGHQHVTVTPDQPRENGTKLPDNPAKTFEGVEVNDLNKTITRTIEVTTPDGKSTTTKQIVKLTRTADVDEVTGYVTYSNWTTGQWDAYETPALKGYTASQNSVEATPVDENTKDQTVEINYTPNKQSTTIKYVDDKGQVVHTTTVTGVTDQTVNVPNEVPTGWTITGGQVPSEITFDADGHEPIEVTVDHRHVTVTPDQPQDNGTKLPDNPAKTFEGVEVNDLNKTITRTIEVTTPDGKSTTTKQIVKLTRTADVDEVTGYVTYSNWTTGQWDAYETPALKGYTASQASVAATPVDENTKDQTVEINYTPNKQSTTIKYVDDKGDVVHTTTVTGVTDQTVNVPNEVPAGWMITEGEVPSEITFDADGHEPVVITISHRHVTVTPDQPRENGTKLPDNPAKTFEGVEVNDLNKTITRTIKVTTPDGQTKTAAQTVKLTRNADVDEVTGEVKYGAWTTGQWDAYETPALKGYTPSQASVEATPVDENTKDQTVDISYTANSQTTHINYVDDAGKTVHTTTITGKTGETVNVPNEVPAGWKITKGEVPSEISFGPNGYADETITIGHQHVTVDPDHPQNNGMKLPDNPAKTFEGVEANDLNKTIIRTIKVTTPDGQTKTVVQTAKLTCTADVDEVTGEVTYGKWATGEWAAYDAPSVAGYTPSQTVVSKESVTATSKDTTVEITYLPMQHQISVEYVDDDDHGKIVKTDQMPGKTDQTITVTPSAPSNYDLVDNGNRTYTVTSDDAQVVQIHVKHHQVTTSESKTVTRTINVHTPHDGTKVVKQTAELTRNVTTDQVTGEKTYGDWTAGQWEAYTPEAIPGYTPSTNEVPNVNVNDNSKNQTVDVTYTADAQKVEIVYVDDTKGGAVVKTDQVAGKTDETVKVTSDVPAGYELVGKVPGDYTMTAGGHQTITVHLVHQMKTVSESKTVTRTINVHTPHDGARTIKQTAELTRDVTTDQVTGEKTYGDWSTAEWDRYAVPAIAGYVPSVEQVAQQVVNGTTTDQTIDVIYSSGEHTTHINYVDGDGNIVHTTTIKGQTDGTAQVPNETPAGWTVVGEPVPTELSFGPDGHSDVTVTVDHQHVTVTPDQPKTPTDKLPDNPAKTYPNGVGHDDLNKTITRTIKITMPGGQTKTVAQTAKLTRTADVDEVTGEVTYGKWTTGEWLNYDVPTVPGYTPSQSEVPAQTVSFGDNDIVKTVTYKANGQKLKVAFIDDTTGKTLNTIEKTGLSDTDSGYNTKADISDYAAKHYDLVSDGTNGKNLMFDHDDDTDQHYEVHLTHHKSDTSRQSTVNETIHYVYENSKQAADDYVAKPIVFTQTGVKDLVTGDTDWNGQWTSDQEFKAVDSPEITGYTPSRKTVDAIKVSHDTSDIKRVVTYVANNQVAKITYIDDVTGKVLATDEVSGKFGSRVDYNALARINSFEKQGYQLKTNGFDQPSYQADDTKNQFEIRLIHQLNKTSRESTVTRTISYVDSITGLTLHQPIIQTLKFIEGGVTDLVTNETTWQTASRQQFVSVKVPEIKGYASELSVVEPAEVGFGDANIETTVKYKKLDVTNTISYVDSQGKVIKTDTVSGQSGTEIKLDVPSGYHLVDNQTKVTISENETKQEVMIAKDDVTNTISYVDSEGKVIKTDTVSGQSGTEIKLDVPSGYHLVDNQTKVTISKNNSTQTVKITKDNSANKIARHLPQTGNQRETGLVALGLATGLLGLVVLRKKRNQ